MGPAAALRSVLKGVQLCLPLGALLCCRCFCTALLSPVICRGSWTGEKVLVEWPGLSANTWALGSFLENTKTDENKQEMSARSTPGAQHSHPVEPWTGTMPIDVEVYLNMYLMLTRDHSTGLLTGKPIADTEQLSFICRELLLSSGFAGAAQ